MTADNDLIEAAAAGNRPLRFAFFIHQVKICDCGKAMVFCDLFMHSRTGAGTSVGRIAFHNRSVEILNQCSDQLGPEIVAGGRFAG